MPEPRLEGGQLLTALSDAMVRLFRSSMGKGPERCKSHWAGSDVLVIMLGGGYTVAEQKLFESGYGGAVQDSRNALQAAMRQEMTAVVEDLTTRKVVAFLSASHQDPDLSAELFVLEPDEADSRGGAADAVSR